MAGPRAGPFLLIGTNDLVGGSKSETEVRNPKQSQRKSSLKTSTQEFTRERHIAWELVVQKCATGLFLLAIVFLAGCRSTPPEPSLNRYEFRHPAMGTLFTVTLYAPEEIGAQEAANAAFRRIDALEDMMSDYQADSELLRFCDQPFGRPVPVSPDLFTVFQRAQTISERSWGAFDVTIGPCVRLWRFTRKRKVLPSPVELASAKNAVDYRKLRLDSKAHTAMLLAPNMRLDLGGIAKGYAADEALKVLNGRGIDCCLVAASGDIAIGNPPPDQKGWKIGIATIDAHANDVTRNLVLHNCGISTSGDTEQFVEIDGVRYSHILDPQTCLGLTNRIQSTIVAPDATATDVLATTVCVLGVTQGLALVESFPRTAALILTKEGERKQSFASKGFEKIALAP